MNVLLALMTALEEKGASTLWEALFVSLVFIALLALLQTQSVENVKVRKEDCPGTQNSFLVMQYMG